MMAIGRINSLSLSSKAFVGSLTLIRKITIPAAFKTTPSKMKNVDILANPINLSNALITSSAVLKFGSNYISIFFILKRRK